MSDIITKITFGFLMAQLVPGTTAVYAALCAYRSFGIDVQKSLPSIGTKALALWTGSFSQQFLILGLCAGVGMLIHGLHWAVIGHLENRKTADGKMSTATGSFWHGLPLFLQVLLGPIKIAIELIMLMFQAPSVADVALHENVQNVPPERMPAFQFVQEFYLHFAQFFAHAAYALAFAFWCGVVCVRNCGLSLPRFWFLVAIWCVAGLYFVISRIQLESLFRAEGHLAGKGSS